MTNFLGYKFKFPNELTLVTDDPRPAIGAVAAITLQITQPSVGTVLAGQTAVMAKRVV